MKHIVCIIIATLATIYIGAQNPTNYPTLPYSEPEPIIANFALGYEHSQTHGSNFNTSMLFSYNAAQWVQASLGFRVSTISLYTFTARGDFKWWLGEKKRSNLTLRNQYIYSIYAVDQMQDLNMALTIAYDHTYFYVGIGGYARMLHPLNSKHSQSIWEPGITYDIEGRIFPKPHNWNIALQISNMRDFQIERLYSPNIILKGNYRIGGYNNDHLNLKIMTGIQPAGIMHVTANYYSFYFNIGISCAL